MQPLIKSWLGSQIVQKRFLSQRLKGTKEDGNNLPVVEGVSVQIRECPDFGQKKNLNHEVREGHEGEQRFQPLIKMMNTDMESVGELPISVYQVRQGKPDFSIDMKSNQHGK